MGGWAGGRLASASNGQRGGERLAACGVGGWWAGAPAKDTTPGLSTLRGVLAAGRRRTRRQASRWRGATDPPCGVARAAVAAPRHCAGRPPPADDHPAHSPAQCAGGGWANVRPPLPFPPLATAHGPAGEAPPNGGRGDLAPTDAHRPPSSLHPLARAHELPASPPGARAGPSPAIPTIPLRSHSGGTARRQERRQSAQTTHSPTAPL